MTLSHIFLGHCVRKIQDSFNFTSRELSNFPLPFLIWTEKKAWAFSAEKFALRGFEKQKPGRLKMIMIMLMLLPPFELSKKCQSSRHHLSDLLSMMSGKSKALKPMVEKLGWRFMSIFLTLPGCSAAAVSRCSVIGQVQKNLRPTGHFIDIYFHWKRAKRRKRWSRPEHHQICMYLYILFNGQVGQYTIFDVLFVVSWKYFGRSKRWSRHKPPQLFFD